MSNFAKWHAYASKHIGDNTADLVVGSLVSICKNDLVQISQLRGNVYQFFHV